MSESGRRTAERRYSVPSNPFMHDPRAMQSEDLHAWSIYRQNLNSDFTDSALGSTDKSPLPYGNFQLRDTTVQSILSHPRYGPKSALGSNMYTYLKFGLPRVFPPNHNGSQRSITPRAKTSISSGMKPVRRVSHQNRGLRENSSGYDSSDNETSPQYKYSRKYRSDPDFRLNNVVHNYQGSQNIPLVAMHQAGIKSNTEQWNGARNKSVSEANLLNIDSRNYGTRQAYNRRNSVADFGNDMEFSQIGSPMSKADSHLSLMHGRKSHHLAPSTRGDYVDGHVPHTAYIYPNIQVKNLELASNESPSMLLVSGVSFEVKAGEILAIMATSESEGTGLLNVLAGIDKKLSGDIILNGQSVSKTTLKNTTAYVKNNIEMCPDMTVVQTLKFHAQLKWPDAKLSHIKVDAKDRINILIEELGLEQVRLTNVGRLTRSELRRLNVACHMLLNTVVLILDQPTKEMDIFDTFFLIEYLRNWATTGRIVVLTLHPPTYEIFAMLSKVVLISAGRTMYSGYRRDLIPYFSSIDYPCPAFKNPSDYYLDLVTLDDLSAAAMLESSGRIEQLAEVFRTAQARIRGDVENAAPMVPPIPLPSPICKANPISQAWILFKKSLIYTQPNSIINWISYLILSALLSLIIGAIYWDLPNSDLLYTQNDRLSYHYVLLCLTIWPLLIMICLQPIHSRRKYVERDIDIGLYGRTIFVLADTLLDVLPTVCIWLVYVIPSYSMTGLYIQGSDNYNGFYLYLGYMLLYLCCIRMCMKAIVYLVPPYKWSSCISTLLLTISFIASGYTLHHLDFPWYLQWTEYITPSRWLMGHFLNRELSPQAIQSNQINKCKNKQVPRLDIIVAHSHCPIPNGTQILMNAGLDKSKLLWGDTDEGVLIALVVFWGVCFIVMCTAFIFDCCHFGKKLTKQSRRGNKCTPNAP